MSTYTIEKFPDEPIIYCWISESCRANELSTIADDVVAILDKADRPFVVINNALNFHMTIDEMIVSANLFAGESSAFLRHPNLHEFVFITNVKLLQLAAEGLKSATFGHVPVKVFETEEDAFAYARALSASQ